MAAKPPSARAHQPPDLSNSEALIQSDKKAEALEQKARDLAHSVETTRQQTLAQSNKKIEALEKKARDLARFVETTRKQVLSQSDKKIEALEQKARDLADFVETLRHQTRAQSEKEIEVLGKKAVDLAHSVETVRKETRKHFESEVAAMGKKARDLAASVEAVGAMTLLQWDSEIAMLGQSHEETVAMNEALLLGSLRQHELTEAADSSNVLLRTEITERKQAEDALKESQERYRVLFSALPVAAFVCDLDATIQYYNLRATELWQREPKIGVDQHCGSIKIWLKDGTFLPHAQSPMMEVMRTGIPARNVEIFIERPDGSRLPVIVNFAALKNAQGEIVGAVTSFDDISERKKAEEALLQAQVQLADRAVQLEGLVSERTAKLQESVSELEGFSYSISHDLRAPLRAMQNFSEMLQEDHAAKLNKTGQDFLRRIATSASRMDKLIQDVLVYSRVLRMDLKLIPVDVEKLLREMFETYSDFQEPKAAVTIEGKLPTVLGNEAALTQCFSNLLDNAVKFVAPGTKPRVQISAERNGERVRFWITDNGIGIDPKYSTVLFGMFQRLNTAYEGTGIGLTIVRKAAERMGGAVGLESELGKGSRFWLDLKLANNTARRALPAH